MSAENPENVAGEPGFSFSDKRRVDPETGQVRPEPQPAPESQAAGTSPAAEGPGVAPESTGAAAEDLGVEIPDDASALADEAVQERSGAGSDSPDATLAAERLNDLQRINAEYAAYRMRAGREQERAKQNGVISVVEALMPVLDEIKLAQENGDVTGPFETHVNRLLESLAKAGVEQYGEVGEEFDPAVHEALMQQPSAEVSEPTVFLVMQPGYRVGERIVRAARVGVQQPED